MPRTTTGTRSLASGPTIASTRDYWVLHLRSEGKAERTVLTYLNALRRLEEFLLDRGMPVEIGAIRREHLEAWIHNMQERGNAPGTISIAFRAVRPFFGWLVDEDEIQVSPMAKMKIQTPPQNPPAVLSPDEQARLLKACAGTDLIARRDFAMISLLLDTGIRRGELAGLRVKDVNLTQQYALIEATTSKSRKGRGIAFGATTGKAIMRYLRHPRAPSDDEDRLWISRTGSALDGNEIFHTLRRRAKQAGLRVNPHQLRHTWASSMLASGHSEGVVMTLGGWSDRSMLQRYGASEASSRARAAYRSPVDAIGRK